mgnify:CR=1 FL=1
MNEPIAALSHMSDGVGDPLVLLNGIAMTAVSWDVVARPLAEHYRVIRCDFRGQLMTPVPPPDNVAKHADAKEVSVVIRLEQSMLRMLVEDDGVGFDPARVEAYINPPATGS